MNAPDIPERRSSLDIVHHIDQRIVVQSIVQPASSRLIVSEPVPQVPDASYYHDLISFPPLVYAGIMVTLAITFRILSAVVNTSGQIRGIFEIPRQIPLMHHIPLVLGELPVCALLSLAFERVLPKSRCKMISLQAALFFIYSAMFQVPMWFEYATMPGKDPHAVMKDPNYKEKSYKPGRPQSFNFLWLMMFYFVLYLGLSFWDFRSRWCEGAIGRSSNDPPREGAKEGVKEDLESQTVRIEKI